MAALSQGSPLCGQPWAMGCNPFRVIKRVYFHWFAAFIQTGLPFAFCDRSVRMLRYDSFSDDDETLGTLWSFNGTRQIDERVIE